MVPLKSRLRRLKTGSVLLGVMLSMTLSLCPAAKTQAAGEINVEYRTKKEIVDYFEANPVKYLTSTYNITPSCTSPYVVGELKQEVLEDALTQLKRIRFVAGLSTDVTLDATYTKMVQATTVVNAANGGLSHTPPQPADMPDDIYQLGAAGALKANIAAGYSTLAGAILDGWLEDSDDMNIDRMGHRRWLLNPRMKKVGFGDTLGKYGSWTMHYQAMYAHDNTGSRYGQVSVWPAQVTPIEYFGSVNAWSYSTGNGEDINSVKVTLKNETRGGTWNFSAASSDGFFNVENNYYALPGCVIFRPSNYENLYQAGDTFKVTITGLTGGDVSYHVTFFSLNAPYQVSFNKNGGSGSMASSGMLANKATYVLPNCTFTAPSGKTFDHWDINGTAYKPGASITVTDDISVKAIWKDTAPYQFKITKQPADYVGAYGKKAVFTVKAVGDGLTYQWQYKKSGVWNDYGVATANDATFKVTMNEKNVKWAMRCVIKDAYGTVLTTNEVWMRDASTPPIVITKQPVDYHGTFGKKATFSVIAVGKALTYQWQYQKKNVWYDYTLATANTATFKVTMNEKNVKWPLRCVITDGDGNTLTTDTVWLKDPSSDVLAITKEPEDWYGTYGKKASFNVTATGVGLTYQWQYKKGGVWYDYAIDTANTANFKVTMNEKNVKWAFRCVITDSNGQSITTNEVWMRLQ